MSALFYRRAFSDHHTLYELSLGNVPEFESWRRRLYLLEQREVVGQPDHLLKSYRDIRFPMCNKKSNMEAFGHLTWASLDSLAERFIERHLGILSIKQDRFQEWHNLITHFSPLMIIVAFLVKEGRLKNHKPQELYRALRQEIGDTALLSSYDPGIEHMIENEGLNEMHMHLNGSTELDTIWPDAVRDPLGFKRYLNDTGDVRDQYENILPNWSVEKLVRVLFSARRARYLIWHVVTKVAQGDDPEISTSAVLNIINSEKTDGDCKRLWCNISGSLAMPYDLKCHPTEGLFDNVRDSGTLLHDEAVFLFMTLDTLRNNSLQSSIALAVFFVFCVQRQIIELSVQQLTQYGFDQFQKFTMNEIRSRVELTYEQRFKQLNIRPPYRVIRHLEGRFAPKNDVKKLEDLLGRIIDGASRFRSSVDNNSISTKPNRLAQLRKPAEGNLIGFGDSSGFGRHDFELSLVAHFIKKPSSLKDALYLKRRTELRKEVKTLTRVLKRRPALAQLVRGVDGAANELHCPAEVFASTFRQSRAAGIPYATFHAGEDFRHLIGGIRAVHDAVTMLNLQAGDRIGHGTAVGIRPGFWLERAPERVLQAPWDTLLDLVFARSLLHVLDGFSAEVHKLENEITDLSLRLIGRNVSASELEAALALRYIDVLEYHDILGASTPSYTYFESRAKTLSTDISRQENALIASVARDKPHVFDLFMELQWKRKNCIYKEPFEMNCDILSARALSAMQSQVINCLNRKRIVIESLPTSNLRISLYDNFVDHHLFRWLGLMVDEPLDIIPDFCVGSDDPGIFATNLKNEFILISEILRNHYGCTHKEVAQIVSSLNRTALAFRFKPGVGKVDAS
ncbi:hypothetical protein QD228_05555 [Cobetia sp. 3AK]|uniref:hypothetical protein n=1 Tax=Cobetia sp. 3AK TaxID=3040020 RepID=UPI00244797B1|nr:hypothetical protein [Cobetia sp. 3AK]MDH2373300.1 hypothetical protein [Cobetia sp. 3AK]